MSDVIYPNPKISSTEKWIRRTKKCILRSSTLDDTFVLQVLEQVINSLGKIPRILPEEIADILANGRYNKVGEAVETIVRLDRPRKQIERITYDEGEDGLLEELEELKELGQLSDNMQKIMTGTTLKKLSEDTGISYNTLKRQLQREAENLLFRRKVYTNA